MSKAITSAEVDAANGNGYVEVAAKQVEIVSSEISADEFVELLATVTEEFPLLPGKHAVIRSLEYQEVKRIIAQNKGNKDELELSALIVGTMYPKLTPEHVAKIRRGNAGPIMLMAKRIMVISGMVDDDKNLGEGGASS